MRLLFALWLLVCVNGPVQAGEPVILVLGDSISAAYGMEMQQGWVQLLQQRLQQQGYPQQVINASISGETTAGGLARLPALLQQHAPEVVVLELGGNDGLRGLAMQQTRNNLARMIELARESHARVVLLGMRLPPNYGPMYTEAFEQMYTDLAAEYGLPEPPFLLEGVALRPDLMQADGIHPTAPAQPQLLNNAWPALRQQLPSVSQSQPAG